MKQFLLLTLVLFACNLSAQNRVVLIEQFTNSSCPPCGAVSPSVYAWANANPGKAVVIAYHTLFPYNNDSMHFENPVEATQRVNFYGVQGVPHSMMDGNVFSGSTYNFVSTISAQVDNRLNTAPRYAIQSSSLSLNGNQLSGQFSFVSTHSLNASEDLAAHLVVIEKNVLKSAYAGSPGANIETEYGYVMRKMIPDAAGTTLLNTTLNANDNISLNWTLSNIKNKEELRVVAFVQNRSTKEVYQAQLFQITGTVGLEELSANGTNTRLYPNPASDELTILLEKEQEIRSVEIFNAAGVLQYEKQIGRASGSLHLDTPLQNGLYLVRINTTTGHRTEKLIIQR